MPEKLSKITEFSQLEAWRMALAGVEAERTRLVTKYDRRIAELKKAIKELENSEKKKNLKVSKIVAEKPKRIRKATANDKVPPPPGG